MKNDEARENVHVSVRVCDNCLLFSNALLAGLLSVSLWKPALCNSVCMPRYQWTVDGQWTLTTGQYWAVLLRTEQTTVCELFEHTPRP